VKEPGIYCLKTSLSVSLPFGGVALAIRADDVVIDLNGHIDRGLRADHGGGGLCDAQKDVTVRNGTIRGFGGAVDLGGFAAAAQGNIVEDVRAEWKQRPSQSRWRARAASCGTTSVVRTGGASGGSIGILGIGAGVHILDNEVSGDGGGSGRPGPRHRDRQRARRRRPGQRRLQRGLGPSDSVGIFVSPTCPQGESAGEPRRQPA
jgi:hypothetical protein